MSINNTQYWRVTNRKRGVTETTETKSPDGTNPIGALNNGENRV